MNRELKFRAWDPIEQKMWNENHIIVGAGMTYTYGGHLIDEEVYHYSPRHKWIPMQFTGLLDSKGKEIWEGDIIRNGWDTTEVGTVVFEYGQFTCDKFGYAETFATQMEDSEVIGNIYENKELLASPE